MISERELFRRTVRLAHAKPKLQPLLLPILTKYANAAKQIGNEQSGPLEGDSDETYMNNHFTQREFHELGRVQKPSETEDNG